MLHLSLDYVVAIVLFVIELPHSVQVVNHIIKELLLLGIVDDLLVDHEGDRVLLDKFDRLCLVPLP